MSVVAGFLLLTFSAPSPAAELRVVDLTGEFDRFAMGTLDMPDAQRVTAFERRIGPIANGFYSREQSPDDYDLRILSQLRAYPERRAATLAVSRDFNRLFLPARRRFEAEFGPLPARQPAFLIDSMGEFDGNVRELDGRPTLLFGADVIAAAHGGQQLSAFFYHELFHLYHDSRIAKCLAVWCSLWSEGLATYASSRLAPGASDDELVLNLPQPIRPAVDADRGRAVCAIAGRLESTTDEDFSALFEGDSNLPGFPSRMGYFIGYLVASDIGRTHNIHQMARMTMAQARPLIDASLARMAPCASKTAEARERSRTDRTRS